MNEVASTSDAALAYHERSGVALATADSSSPDGTVASFSRNNTIVVAQTTFYPVYAPEVTLLPPAEQDNPIIEFVEP